MKLAHPDVSALIKNEETRFVEWVIESPRLFSKYVQELFEQCGGAEGKFVLSHADEMIEISKNTEMIINPFSVNINEKKILNKLYIELSQLAKSEGMYLKTQEIMQQVYKYLQELEQQTDYILEINPEIDLPMIFKAAEMKHEVFEENFFERLVRYMKILQELSDINLFLLVNVRSFLCDSQLEELLKAAIYQEIEILFIENCDRGCMKGVFRYIIDKDYCEIY